MTYSFGSSLLTPILIGLLVFIAVIFILRELVTWYWKINRIVELLEDIEYNTRPTDDEDDQADKEEN